MKNALRTILYATVTAVTLGVLLFASTASAFCGFYVSGADTSLFNEATMVVLMRDGRRTVLSMENHYDGPAEDFAMVIPVPQVLQEENVKTLPSDVFTRVDQMGAPRLVEYWERDPCQPYPVYESQDASGGPQDSASYADGGGNPGGVVIEAEFTVGEYNIVVLSADDSTGLDTWLRDNNYSIPDGADELLRPYVESGMYFFVAKVDVEKVSFDAEGNAQLSPIRFYYDSDDFSLPIRLGLINANEKQDLIVNILAQDQRYEVANYPNVQIPTNIAVTEAVRTQFAEFYVALMDETLEQNPGAVITEYSWNASTCDPCPGVSLTPEDFATLGADVAPGAAGDPFYYRSSYTLTRLHARYDAGEVGDDLVFRTAEPLTGGRGTPDAEGVLSQDVETAAYTNNFQGRYAILNRWEGSVDCNEPAFGLWGRPPVGETAGRGIQSAQGTAFVDRNAVNLKDVIAADVGSLGLTAPPENQLGNQQINHPATGGGCATANPLNGNLAWVALIGALGFFWRR